MRLGSILKLIEDLIFELLSWVLFIPKTFVLAVQPGKVQAYVSAEWASEEGERYTEFVPPILFYIGMNLFGVLEVTASVGRSPLEYLGRLLLLTDFVLIQILFGVFLWPLLCAIVLQLAQAVRRRSDFDRATFRRHFDMQCLYWGIFVAVGPLVGISSRLAPEAVSTFFAMVGVGFEVAVMFYLAFLISKTVAPELNLRWYYALALSIALVVAVRLSVNQLIGDVHAPLLELIDG